MIILWKVCDENVGFLSTVIYIWACLGKPHRNPEHPDYVPSVFPSVYKNKTKSPRRVICRSPATPKSSCSEFDEIMKEVLQRQEYLHKESEVLMAEFDDREQRKLNEEKKKREIDEIVQSFQARQDSVLIGLENDGNDHGNKGDINEQGMNKEDAYKDMDDDEEDTNEQKIDEENTYEDTDNQRLDEDDDEEEDTNEQGMDEEDAYEDTEKLGLNEDCTEEDMNEEDACEDTDNQRFDEEDTNKQGMDEQYHDEDADRQEMNKEGEGEEDASSTAKNCSSCKEKTAKITQLKSELAQLDNKLKKYTVQCNSFAKG